MDQSTCTAPDCERQVLARGLCSRHYQRLKYAGKLEPLPDPRIACRIEECGGFSRVRDLCKTHYRRLQRTGDPERKGLCGECGQSFKAPERGRVSEKCESCRRQTYLEQQKAWMKRNYVPVVNSRECSDCGAVYEPPGRDTNSVRCKPCRAVERRRKARAWEQANKKPVTDAKRLRLKAYKHRRRVQSRTAPYDTFTAPEIYERDSWECQICGLSIDPEVKFPAPESASLDHIIPLARGGTHTLGNVQLACMGCNWAKGARMSA